MQSALPFKLRGDKFGIREKPLVGNIIILSEQRT